MRMVRQNPDTVAPPVGNYSQVVRVETTESIWIYISGQVSLDAAGAFVGEGDMRAQTQQVFENLKAILDANGAAFEHVVKVTTYVTTLDDLAGMREVRSRYFPSEPPASTAVQITALFVPEAMIEVDVVAVIAA
jgi:2-iminobutanoate/2-iminopropanoate deaminase